MSLLAAVLLGYAAVHAFAASMAAFLYLRMRAREYIGFGATAGSLAVYCVAASQVTDAHSAAESARWLELEFASGATAMLALTWFAHLMVGRPSRRVVDWVGAAYLFGLPTTLAGAYVDPGLGDPTAMVLFHATPSHIAAVTPLLYVYTVGGVGIGALILTSLYRAAKDRADARFLAIAMSGMILGWVLDTIFLALGVRTIRVGYHLASLSALLCSYLLLHRFVHTTVALSERTHELRVSYDELRHVQEELVRKEQLAAVGELSAVIAHEVRNPLAVLQTAVATLRKPNLGDTDRATLLEVLDEENDRLNGLVRDLLTYARPVEPQTTTFPLDQTLRRAIARAERSVEGTEYQVEIDTEHAPDLLDGDPDLLEKAFANVAENALQAMPRGGVLSVRAEVAVRGGEPVVAFRFHDTGEGMDTLIRSRATDPFFTTRPSGTGLGLAIVERVISAHGGEVRLESDQEGTTVTLFLPARSPSDTPP